ncbi:MAG: hypothetical protein RIF41_26815 [Polyangiaceae bacterium]
MLRRAKAAHEGGVEMILAPNTDLVGMFEVGDGTVLGDTAVRWKLGHFVGAPGMVIAGESPTVLGAELKIGTVIP